MRSDGENVYDKGVGAFAAVVSIFRAPFPYKERRKEARERSFAYTLLDENRSNLCYSGKLHFWRAR